MLECPAEIVSVSEDDFTESGSKEERKCSHLCSYPLDPRFGLGILCYRDGFFPCPLQSFVIGYDAMDGVGMDCPSRWTEDPDARWQCPVCHL